MSKEYVKADRDKVIAGLFDRLQTFEDGTSITTWRLLKSEGYDMRRFDEGDLADIDHTLKTTAEEHGLILDMSAHMFKLEGLPYNLDYIVYHNGDSKK